MLKRGHDRHICSLGLRETLKIQRERGDRAKFLKREESNRPRIKPMRLVFG